MLRKTILVVVVVIVLVGTVSLIAQERRSRGSISFTSSPMSKNEAEEKILSVLQDMYDSQRGGMMNVPPEDGRLLRMLTETANAQHVVEIGTSNGYSGLWLLLALQATGGAPKAKRCSCSSRMTWRRSGIAGRAPSSSRQATTSATCRPRESFRRLGRNSLPKGRKALISQASSAA